MNKVTEIMSKTEFDEVIATDKPVLVDFFATWCAPCKMQGPILQEFKEEMGDKVEVIKVDVDQLPQLADEYRVAAIPTILVIKDKKIKDKAVGLTTKANLSDLLIRYL